MAILNKVVAFYNVTPFSFVTGVKVSDELTAFFFTVKEWASVNTKHLLQLRLTSFLL
jgi:hypothetical protein